MKPNISKIIIGLGVLAGIVYNSWPLSYFLNPRIAGSALASGLEAGGQPYNWLFISLDILTGVLTILIAAVVYKKNKLLITSLIGVVGFGVLTALDAVLPIDCSGNIDSCGYQGNQAFGVHDLIGAFAALSLFIGMLFATRLAIKTKSYVWDKWWLIAWSVIGLSYTLVAVPAINKLSYITKLAVIWQDAFLILSGLLVALCSYTYVNLKATKSSK